MALVQHYYNLKVHYFILFYRSKLEKTFFGKWSPYTTPRYFVGVPLGPRRWERGSTWASKLKTFLCSTTYLCRAGRYISDQSVSQSQPITAIGSADTHFPDAFFTFGSIGQPITAFRSIGQPIGQPNPCGSIYLCTCTHLSALLVNHDRGTLAHAM
jgi:hypothetical protein